MTRASLCSTGAERLERDTATTEGQGCSSHVGFEFLMNLTDEIPLSDVMMKPNSRGVPDRFEQLATPAARFKQRGGGESRSDDGGASIHPPSAHPRH